jgi:ParB family transcriptional regulator, chromosome partitioning protein
MVKKRGLGKSLDALLSYTGSTGHNAVEEKTTAFAQPDQDHLAQLSISCIGPGKYQPRREMDQQALEELAESIRTQGIIQPLIVRPLPGGQKDHYEIIAGERRFRAAKLAGLKEVPAIIRHIPDEAAVAIALIENIQRENLNPIEEAMALQRLMSEFGLTHQQTAQAVGKSRTAVTNLLRLLSLPEEVKKMLEQGALEMGHARTLITLPEETQLEAAQLIISRQLSVREAEQLVRRLQSPEAEQQKPQQDPDIQHLQNNLAQQLKLRVAIKCNAKGRGKLVIHYKSLAELNGLLLQFQGR